MRLLLFMIIWLCKYAYYDIARNWNSYIVNKKFTRHFCKSNSCFLFSLAIVQDIRKLSGKIS